MAVPTRPRAGMPPASEAWRICVRHARLTTFAVAVVAAVWMAMPQLAARQAAPGAPAGPELPSGSTRQRPAEWTHATGTFTHYNIEAAAGPGLPPFLVLPTSSFANPDPFSKLPERLSSFSAAGIGAGRPTTCDPRAERRRRRRRRQQRDRCCRCRGLPAARRAHQLRRHRARRLGLPEVEPGQRRPAVDAYIVQAPVRSQRPEPADSAAARQRLLQPWHPGRELST